MGSGKTWSETDRVWAAAGLYAQEIPLGALGLSEEDELIVRAMVMQAFLAGFCQGVTTHTGLARPGVAGPN